MSPVGVVIVKFTRAIAIARVLIRVNVRAGRGATFGAGVTALFVAYLPVVRSRAPTSLSRGGATIGLWPLRVSHRVSAAFTMAAAILWLPAPTTSCMEGGRQIRNMARNKSLSGETPGGRCCLSFPMRTLGLRPCISMGRQAKQFKIGLPFAFPNCPSKASFKQSNGLTESLDV